MQKFDFLLKTELFFGENRVDEIGDIINKYSFKKKEERMCFFVFKLFIKFTPYLHELKLYFWE